MIIKSSWELKTEYRDASLAMIDSKVFSRQIDIILVGIAIGLSYDKFEEQSGEQSLSVPYNTLNNSEISETINILYQSAILTSTVAREKFDEATRLQLAFDPEYEVDGFSKTRFILGFAGYGIKILSEEINNNSADIFYNNLKQFFINGLEKINFKNLNLVELGDKNVEN